MSRALNWLFSISRCVRFSLRALLILFTVVTLWLGWWFNRTTEQRQAARAIQAVAGQVFYDFDTPIKNTFTGSGTSRVPRRLVDWLGVDTFHSVACVDLDGPKVTDASLERLGAFPRLRHLYLGNTNVSSDGLRHLASLTKLERVVIKSNQLDQVGLGHLARLPNLTDLEIHFSPQVTDRAIAALEGATHLRRLWLYETQVTKLGVARLRKALPRCTIECDPPRGSGLLTAN
jgi:hypothetical protein